jgi:hypothetical protein
MKSETEKLRQQEKERDFLHSGDAFRVFAVGLLSGAAPGLCRSHTCHPCLGSLRTNVSFSDTAVGDKYWHGNCHLPMVFLIRHAAAMLKLCISSWTS